MKSSGEEGGGKVTWAWGKRGWKKRKGLTSFLAHNHNVGLDLCIECLLRLVLEPLVHMSLNRLEPLDNRLQR